MEWKYIVWVGGVMIITPTMKQQKGIMTNGLKKDMMTRRKELN